MNGTGNRVLLVLMLLATAVVLVCALWLVWPYDVLQQEQEPLPLLKTTLRPGDQIVYHARYTKYMDVVGVASVWLMNDTITAYPPVIYSGRPGRIDTWSRTFNVPLNMPSGRYYLSFAVEYRVNPIRTIVERYRTEDFEVVE